MIRGQNISMVSLMLNLTRYVQILLPWSPMPPVPLMLSVLLLLLGLIEFLPFQPCQHNTERLSYIVFRFVSAMRYSCVPDQGIRRFIAE